MKLIRHASVGIKVALAPVFAIACLVVVAAVGLWGSLSATRALADINQARIPGLILAAELERRIATVSADVNQSLVWEGAGVKAVTIAALDKQIGSDLRTLAAFIDAQQGNPIWSGQDKATLKNIAAEFGKYRAAAGDSLDIKSTGLGAAAGFITRGESSYRQLHRLIDQLVTGQQNLTQAVVTDANALATRNQVLTVITVLAAIALAGAATWWCWQLIVAPLVQASRIASAVAKGDLQTPTVSNTSDETGKLLTALREVTVSLNRILGDIKAAAGDIDLVSEKIAFGNGNLSARTEQASSALAEAAASLEQLTASVQLSAGNAKTAHALANDAASAAREGGAVVNDAVQSIEEVTEQSKRISEIVGIIDGIAFQTNVLALNAAVEAARAGESGRGFAVVAGEVRTLAQRSATAAKEIRELIGKSVVQINTGARKVRSAGEAMQRIVESIERVSVVVREISNASAEQAAGILQISVAVGELDRSTQQNGALVDEASLTAKSLKEQSHRLLRTISVFRTHQERSAALVV